MINRFCFGILLLMACYSCKLLKVGAELRKTEATVYSYTVNNKDIKYIPMHHLGKLEFYEDVKNRVIDLKSKGYVVYYEKIKVDTENLSIQYDTIRRKYRKIRGFNGTYKEIVSKIGILKNYVQQPSNEGLGGDNKDVRADVTAVELVQEWEKQNGTILLDSLDMKTNFDTTYRREKFFKKSQRDKIIIQFRNQHLINTIKEKGNPKILILYGAGHRKDLEKKILNNKDF
jgi:hypothetical protein